MSDRYAVIGNPIAHTRSPRIHHLFAQATGQDMRYTALESPTDGFADCLRTFQANGGRGVNVTVPFKLEAFACATRCSDRARLAGAANALKFEDDQVLADNFDGTGLLRDVLHNLKQPMSGRRVLILGAGGAARGMLLPFLEQRPHSLTIANLALPTAQALASEVASLGRVSACTYQDLDSPFDMVFNATSASLYGQLPPVTAQAFAPGALAYELVYGKGLTPFMQLAQDAGAGTLSDGLGMLVEQAAEAFAWWRGIRPDTPPVIQLLREELAKPQP